MGKLLQFKRPEAYPQMERICEILAAAPEGFTLQEISEILSSDRKTVASSMSRLKGKGFSGPQRIVSNRKRRCVVTGLKTPVWVLKENA